MKKSFFKNTQWSILICMILLIVIGFTALYSATISSNTDELTKQIIWFFIGIPIMIAVIVIDYKLIAKVSPFFYGIILILLVLVLFTKPINGATSWFEIGSFSLQPAEFAKIFVTIVFANVIVRIQSKGKQEISNPLKLIVSS